MSRPGQRAMKALPVLAPHRDALEKCVFCPKLCRSACPVSNAEPKETITPWGKMSMAYFAAHGDVPRDATYAATAWACTGCQACRESCDHHNDVTRTLLAARAGFFDAGTAPAAASAAVRGFAGHARATREATAALGAHPAVVPEAPDALLVGCTATRALPDQARDAIEAAASLARGPVSLVGSCCGLPLLHAGDTRGFLAQAKLVRAETHDKRRVFVADSGCAMALRVHVPRALSGDGRGEGSGLARVVTLVEAAAEQSSRLEALPRSEGPVRYHDACQLARGLGVIDEPRAVMKRLLGRPPDEFTEMGHKGGCSGGGGMLPRAMPQTSKEIARARARDHALRGGGRIVTTCGSSLLSFRRAGAQADDLSTWIARGLPRWRP